MSIRLFDGAYHAATYSKFRPKPPAALVQRIVDYLGEKINKKACAVDVGCGNGQSTSILAPHFEKVYGQDISKAQIEEGIKLEKNSNVLYSVSSAEKLEYPSSSVDLVTACQAAHWFDLPVFYKEVDRILQPNGVLALYGYKLPEPIYKNDKEILKSSVIDMYRNIDEYVLDGSKETYLGNYTDLRFHESFYKENVFTRDDATFSHSVESSVEDLVGYIRTWSGIQNFKNKHGEKAERAVVEFSNGIMKKLQVSTSPKDTPITVVFPYFLLMGRKP